MARRETLTVTDRMVRMKNLKFHISNLKSLFRLAAVALAFVVATCGVRVGAAAQDTVTGAFEGTVTDGVTGRPIARARVEFVNQQTGVSVSKLADSQGRFFQGSSRRAPTPSAPRPRATSRARPCSD